MKDRFAVSHGLAILLLMPLLSAQTGWGNSGLMPTHLRCEYRENPLGIDAAKPRLSWIIADSESEISNLNLKWPGGETSCLSGRGGEFGRTARRSRQS